MEKRYVFVLTFPGKELLNIPQFPVHEQFARLFFFALFLQVLFDVDGHTSKEITQRLVETLGKSKETLAAERLKVLKKNNPANFGRGCERYCICSEPGQLPCPAIVPVPKFWRGKYYYHGFQDEEE